jgi:hypothetical protein
MRIEEACLALLADKEVILASLLQPGKPVLAGKAEGLSHLLVSVLDEKAPSNPADWQLRDAREARELLKSSEGQS